MSDADHLHLLAALATLSAVAGAACVWVVVCVLQYLFGDPE